MSLFKYCFSPFIVIYFSLSSSVILFHHASWFNGQLGCGQPHEPPKSWHALLSGLVAQFLSHVVPKAGDFAKALEHSEKAYKLDLRCTEAAF